MADYLELRDDCLAGPTRWDLAVIEAQMLWPHDAATRSRYMSAVSTKLNVAAIDRVPLQKPTPTEVREFGEMLLTAPRIGDFTKAAQKAFVHGAVAGKLLHEAIGLHEIGRENAGLGGIKSMLAACLGPGRHLSQKTIDNTVWPRYRAVAHFWAAHFSEETDSGVFPCRTRELALFLATAEAYRRLGETIRSTSKSPTTVLRPGDAVMIPPTIALPEFALKFSRNVK